MRETPLLSVRDLKLVFDGRKGPLTALDGAVAKYGAGVLKTDTKTWLADEATTGALNGLFYYLAREEQAIRRDPVKRTSDLLRKVFGG
jgi:hypothetical protein